jgi:FdhD protein
MRVGANASREILSRSLALETPVAIELNGIGYAVLMATPVDLEDLAYGFALSERLIQRADDIRDVLLHDTGDGIILRVTLADPARVTDRVRHRNTDSSCGLCGIENLEQAVRALPRLTAISRADDEAVFRAAAALRDLQPLNRVTGAVHAAAACEATGAVRLVREDVGRHNAFDKLIGALLRQRLDWEAGFALLSSRCSYELVEKAVLSGCPLLATISAPTELAVRRAADAGLPLRTLVRSDALLSR